MLALLLAVPLLIVCLWWLIMSLIGLFASIWPILLVALLFWLEIKAIREE